MATIDAAELDRGPRLAVIDIARGVAILAMVGYHIGFDLSQYRLIATDVANDMGWTVWARSTASAFLLLVGISLVLATRNGFRRDAFLRRLVLVVGGAALVSLGTWLFNPETFVFFGILHEIAVASVLALPFLRLPSVAVGAVAAAVIAAPWFLASPIFNTPALLWVGLSTERPVSIDYVPVLPWFGVVLAGIIVGRLIVAFEGSLSRWRPDNLPVRWLMIAGRWSLVIYLVHQPLIIGVLATASPLFPPAQETVRANFTASCTAACRQDRDEATCGVFCGCMFDGLYGTELFAKNSFAEMSPAEVDRFNEIVGACSLPAPRPAN